MEAQCSPFWRGGVHFQSSRIDLEREGKIEELIFCKILSGTQHFDICLYGWLDIIRTAPCSGEETTNCQGAEVRVATGASYVTVVADLSTRWRAWFNSWF